MENFRYSKTKPNILQIVLDLQFVGEKVVASLARSIDSKFNVMFCCLDRIGLLGEELKKEGFFVTSLNRKPGFDYTLPAKIACLAREKNIDIIHAHHYSSFFYSALSRFLYYKSRLLFTEHGRPLPDIVDYKRKFANLILQHFANKITAVCEFSKKGLCRNEWILLSKVEVIYNGVELNGDDVYQEDSGKITRVLEWIGNSEKVVGFLARLDPIKAPEVLIKAFAQVVKEVPDAKLVMIGKGEMRPFLECLCLEYRISDRVLFTGLIKNPYPIFPKLRILVVSSLYEAASLSILEAMMYGIPVIASRVGGNPELIKDGENGYLIPSGCIDGFAKAIIRLLLNRNLNHKFCKSAQIRAKEKFHLSKMIREYIEIYWELINGRKNNVWNYRNI